MAGGGDFSEVSPDPDAVYERVVEIDASALVPMVSFPHRVDNVRTIDEAKGKKMNQVFIGTCTNSRIEDLRVAAEILRGKKRHPDTRLIIVPSSRRVYSQALEEGLLAIFNDAGASINSPGCGPCVGVHMGILGDGGSLSFEPEPQFQGAHGQPGSVYLSREPGNLCCECCGG